jgi:hypothetical protein
MPVKHRMMDSVSEESFLNVSVMLSALIENLFKAKNRSSAACDHVSLAFVDVGAFSK